MDRVIRAAPVRAAVAILWLLAIAIVSGHVPIADPFLKGVVGGALVYAGYATYVKWIERRALIEFAIAFAPVELAGGLAIGTALFATTVGIIWVLGDYSVVAVGHPMAMWAPLGLAVVSAVPEEILFRGVIFRIADEGIGSVGALTLSSALFGAAHLANPHATILSSVAIALEAGVLLGAAFMCTRRLWLPIGLHAAWNFTQAGIFGLPVSGRPVDGLLVSHLGGPAWVSGGAFGVEASLPAAVVCVGAGCVFLRRAWRRGLVRPWGMEDASPVTTGRRT